MSSDALLAPPPNAAGRGARRDMRLVFCLLRPEKLQLVTEALNQLNLVGGMTVADVRGFGHQRGQAGFYRGEPFETRLLQKVRLDLVVPAENVPQVMAVVAKTAFTGEVGDGKMFVVAVTDALRVRTQERGLSAL